jgi:hypothetical protein
MERAGTMVPYKDTLRGTSGIGEELRFYGEAALELNQYMVR